MLSQQHASSAEEQRNRLLLSIVGVLLPLVAGTMAWWIPALWGHGDVFDEPTSFYITAAATILLAFAGAALLRTWWALLIVPAAWAVGFMGFGLAVGGWPDWQAFWQGAAFGLGIPAVVLAIVAGLGVFFGQWLTRRRATASAHAT